MRYSFVVCLCVTSMAVASAMQPGAPSRKLNVAHRGTVFIGKSSDGRGKVKWVQAREPGKAMNWEEVLAWLAA